MTIRPAGHAGLCLTDGRDRRGAYDSAVAVHLPCAEVPVPRTYLEPAGAGLYRIQWHHPELGKGCLTVLGDGPVKGMLEPRDDCANATLFRPEPRPEGLRSRRRLPVPYGAGRAVRGHRRRLGGGGRGGRAGALCGRGDSLDQYFVVRAD